MFIAITVQYVQTSICLDVGTQRDPISKVLVNQTSLFSLQINPYPLSVCVCV